MLGPPLARRRALCRLQRSLRELHVFRRVALLQLCGRRVQRLEAIPAVPHRATVRRPDLLPHAAGAARQHRRHLTGWNLHPLGPGGQAAYDAFLAHEESLVERMKEQKDLQMKRDALKKGTKPAYREEAGAAKPGANVDPKTELERIEERLA